MRLPADVIIHYEENKSGTGIEEIVLGELIRCKDCIHFKPFVENDGMWCDMLEIDLGENGFCSYGERKDNG